MAMQHTEVVVLVPQQPEENIIAIKHQEEETIMVKKREEADRQGKCCNVDGRERLKRHRNDVAGRVRVPDLWGQEGFLKDWSDCSNQFDKSLSSSKILSARAALLEEAARRRRSATVNMNINSSAVLG